MDARLTPQSVFARLRAWIILSSASASFLLASGFAFAEQPLSETIQVQTFPTHSRLVFHVDDGVPVTWKPTVSGFEILFKGIGFTDLGAPLGEEEIWAKNFQKQLRDPRLSSIELHEVAGGLKIVGQWKFPSGPTAPADPKMDTFDYRERAPGQFIVDFWLKKGLTVAEAQALRKKLAHEAKVHRERAEIHQRVSRRVASERVKSEINDLGRFCAEPLNDSKDVFLTFLPVNEKIDYFKYLPHGAADADYTYFEPKGDATDERYVRLALKLYREGKFALVNRTIDFLDTEQPSSPYRQEMKFLRANAMAKLGYEAEAQKLLNELKIEAKGKPVALHAALYLAAKFVGPAESEGANRTGPQKEAPPFQDPRFKDPLQAYETFSWLVSHYPDHRLAWLFHLGAAEALSAIKQTEQAAKEYLWVAKNAPGDEERAKGALRLGDVYLGRRDYPQALEAYTRGIRYFKKEAESYPAIHLNRAETLYGLGEFEEARKLFESFLQKYSGYPQGWRASYRLGEIAGRRAGAKNEKTSRQWFYETINHYPLSSGATLARLRLLPCGDHGGFTFESATRFFDGEARNFDASNEISMVRFGDYRGLAQVRSYIHLNRYDSAIEAVEREISLTKSASVKSVMSQMFEELFRKNILAFLDQGKSYEALQFYEDHAKFRVKGTDPVDPDYLLGLSLAASKLGLGKKAEVFAEEFKKASSKNRAVAEVKKEDLDSRLKRSQQAFAEGRALWISADTTKEGPDGPRNADLIRTKLEQVSVESPFSFEKEIILGLLEEKQGKIKTARQHVLKAQVLIPAGKGSEADTVSLQILGWLAGLESKAGDSRSALSMYRDLESRLRAQAKRDGAKAENASGSEKAESGDSVSDASALGVPPTPTLERALLSQAAILDSMRRWGETAAAYSKAMELGLGGNQAMYGYARALLKAGDRSSREKASQALKKLMESKTDDFWKKLAQETLANLQIKKD